MQSPASFATRAASPAALVVALLCPPAGGLTSRPSITAGKAGGGRRPTVTSVVPDSSGGIRCAVNGSGFDQAQ
jgi:hypothetical protein